MRVIAISDTHGNLIDVNEFDLLLHCGDVTPIIRKSRKHYMPESSSRSQKWTWLNTVFVNWVLNLPFKDENSRVVMIAGNHDSCLEGLGKEKRREWLDKFNGRLIYLDNEEYEFKHEGKTYRIFGCPYCKIFGNWAFMRSNLEKYYQFIPADVDFLITHDAADINDLGLISEGEYKGKNAGNEALAEYVLNSTPKFYFCGHIHSGNHQLSTTNGIFMANTSVLDEDYNISYKPLELEF